MESCMGRIGDTNKEEVIILDGGGVYSLMSLQKAATLGRLDPRGSPIKGVGGRLNTKGTITIPVTIGKTTLPVLFHTVDDTLPTLLSYPQQIAFGLRKDLIEKTVKPRCGTGLPLIFVVAPGKSEETSEAFARDLQDLTSQLEEGPRKACVEPIKITTTSEPRREPARRMSPEHAGDPAALTGERFGHTRRARGMGGSGVARAQTRRQAAVSH